MDLEFLTDPATFLREAEPVLAADPVLATVPGSIARRRADGQEASAPGDWWLLVREEGVVIGVGMRTAPFGDRPAYLLPMPDDAAVALARALHERGEELLAAGGVAGPVTACLEETARLIGGSAQVQRHERLFALGGLVDPRPVRGTLEQVTEADLDLASAWFEAFMGDADEQGGRKRGTTPHLVREDDMLRRVHSGRLWFWKVDGEPVHVSAANNSSLGTARIGPVYTPPEQRGHGWASAAVGEICRRLLADGDLPCLFTDQANPTSNKIYLALGFEARADMVSMQIVGADGSPD